MYMNLLEKNLLPDWLIRLGIRHTIRQGANARSAENVEQQQAHMQMLVNRLKNSPVAINTAEANEQHYELPAQFFQTVLGPRLKYSGCYWDNNIQTLAQAEEAMLKLTCERACLEDGMTILELGCGWGSLSLWMAEQYPNSDITAISNSHGQRQFIEAQCEQRGVTNLRVITCDVNEFDTARRFDRVVSVEMFEHMKNYEELMARIAMWLNQTGMLFVHIFTHREFAFEFEKGSGDNSPSNWMGRYFFTGGNMPADDLLLYFQQDLTIREHWRVDGRHYGKTLEAWLQTMDANESSLRPILRDVYGADEETRWWVYWRLFFLVCAETFNFRGGQEYMVSHYLFEKK
jgi:cyclopropane-fatty-acyl-phospholipid synthase